MRQHVTTAALIVAIGWIAYDRLASHSPHARAAGMTVTVKPALLRYPHGESVVITGPVLGFSCVPQTAAPGGPPQPECFVLFGE